MIFAATSFGSTFSKACSSVAREVPLSRMLAGFGFRPALAVCRHASTAARLIRLIALDAASGVEFEFQFARAAPSKTRTVCGQSEITCINSKTCRGTSGIQSECGARLNCVLTVFLSVF